MNHLNVKKFGFAIGTTGGLLYLGCMFVMLVGRHDGTVRFFNSLLHGLDVSSIVRMDMALGEALIGLIETFILGWLIGGCIAAIYNISVKE